MRTWKRIDWPIEQMREWYEKDGLTCLEIAQKLGKNPKAVNKACKRFGFQMRPAHQRPGSLSKSWKGGLTVDKSGYILQHMPGHPASNAAGYVRQHRLVMEQKLGRPLLPTEVVHHIDDDPANNDPANLRLYQNNAEHLAETLAGKCPQWTEEGKSRIAAGVEKAVKTRQSRATYSRQKERDARRLQRESARLTGET